MGSLVLLLLLVILVGTLPVYGYSSTWGYGPSGIAGVVLILLLVLVLMGRV